MNGITTPLDDHQVHVITVPTSWSFWMAGVGLLVLGWLTWSAGFLWPHPVRVTAELIDASGQVIATDTQQQPMGTPLHLNLNPLPLHIHWESIDLEQGLPADQWPRQVWCYVHGVSQHQAWRVQGEPIWHSDRMGIFTIPVQQQGGGIWGYVRLTLQAKSPSLVKILQPWS